MSDNKIVVTFLKQSSIHYSFGVIEPSENITWKVIYEDTRNKGVNPHVSINNELAVIIYNSKAFLSSSTLWTIVGIINNDSVTWGRLQNHTSPDFNGEYPSIAMLRDEDATIVTTFQTGVAAARKLFARCGRVQKDERHCQIEWHEEKAGHFMQGCYSSLAAVNEKVFIEMHCTNKLGGDGIWFHVGKADQL